MRKNHYWFIELIIIIISFSIVIQYIVFIGANNYNHLLSSLVLSIIFCSSLLAFAVLKLIKPAKKARDLRGLKFKRKFTLKDIFNMTALVILGPIFYRLIENWDFVYFWGIHGLHHNCNLTSLQAWSLLSLISILLPVGVLAEELYFRCYLFELQYDRFKNYTWIINGISWSLYHVFTPTNFLAFMPTCFMYSYVYQKYRNIWITIIAHLINNLLSYYPAIKGYISYL